MLVINNDNTKYDYDNDVLYAYFREENNVSADEVEPGIYVYKDETTNEVVKITFMNFNKRYIIIRKWIQNNDCTIADNFIL